MKWIQQTVLWLGVFFRLVTAQVETIVQGELAAKIDSFMTTTTDENFAGVLLIAQNDGVILSKGYGLANRAKNVAVTPETVFDIGSITKQFTGAAILKLEEQGKLRTDDSITNYFTNVPDDKAGITLHHLLTHTAGLVDSLGDDYAVINREAYLELAMNTPLRHKPGEVYEYSNVGYSLLAAIIELVTGQSYEVYLHDNLFVPAGMTETGYVLPNWQTDELAHGYTSLGQDWGSPVDQVWADDGPYWHLRGNGGILSTSLDMYKWHLALEGNAILSEESKRKLYAPHVEEGDGNGTLWGTFYGYGWSIATTPRNTTLITHNGGNDIFAADFLRYPDDNVVVYMASSAGYPDAIELSAQITPLLFGSMSATDVEQFTLDILEQSPVGRHTLAFLEMLNGTGDKSVMTFVDEHISPDLLTVVQRETFIETVLQFRRDIGAVEVESITQRGETKLELFLRSVATGEEVKITLEFEKAEPYFINGIGMND